MRVSSIIIIGGLGYRSVAWADQVSGSAASSATDLSPLLWMGLIVLLAIFALVQTRRVLRFKRESAASSKGEMSARDDLERRITLRISELESANRQLQQEMSERKRSEQELIRLERLRALAELSAGVSHNLNNLLTGILGPAELLEMASDDPNLRVYTEMIMQSARRAAEVVERLHSAVQVDVVEELAAVSVEDAIENAIAVTRPRWKDEAESRGAQIVVECDLYEGLQVRGDLTDLRDIFVNLILNAVDAMPNGGTLSFASRVDNNRVFISVRDTGVGMDEAVLARVFEPFFTTKMDVGSGLGMAIAHGALRRWGGGIAVESAPGKGTTFTLELPVWEAREAVMPSQEARQTSETEPKRILLVDDEDMVVDVIQTALENLHTVDAALSGQEGLVLWAQHAYDIALIDLGMPDMPGNQVAEQIKRANPKVVTVMVTGWRLNDDDPRLQWFDLVEEKPFKNLNAIRTFVAQAAALHDAWMRDEQQD